MKEDNTAGYGQYFGYSVTAALMLAWILAAWTGFMLGVVPYSPGDDKVTLLLGYTRAEWGIIHSWLSVIAVFVTAVEIVISRKFLREGLGYLTEAESKQAAD